MTDILVPLPDGRWLALAPEALRSALDRAEGMGFGPSAAPAQAPVASEPLLDSQAMGERLGVTPEWCEAAAKTGEIPSLRVGRYLRFDPAQVLASLQKRRHADRRT